jgi:prepilin-type N-terminal cleavage/methylation domain-containing protein
MKTRAFTLVELLVVIALIAVLAVMIAPQVAKMQEASWKAVSAHTLRSLSAAGIAYRGEHDGEFWPYRTDDRAGIQWWFGRESASSMSQGEGRRMVDFTKGPLGPYAIASGGHIGSDPAFLAAKPRHKPKFENGNYGYGYNSLLGGGVMGRAKLARGQSFERPGELVVFATSAQVNTFQPPASDGHPMLEEFYLINDRETTVHFRFNGFALAAMVDGSLRELPMYPGTLDRRMPEAHVGRFAPVGSLEHLSE